MIDFSEWKYEFNWEAFKEDAVENISLMKHVIYGNGGDYTAENMNKLFKAAYSLSQISGRHKLKIMYDLSSGLENVFGALRMGEIEVTAEFTSAVKESIGLLEEMVNEYSSQANQAGKVGASLKGIYENRKNRPPSKNEIMEKLHLDDNFFKSLTEYEEHRLAENIKSGRLIMEINVTYPIDTFDEQLTRLNTGLKQHGELITTLPSTKACKEDEISFKLLVAAFEDKGTDIIHVVGDASATVYAIQ